MAANPAHVEKRVFRTLPDWQKWPRLLRRVYLLLPSHGVGVPGLESMCDDLGVTLQRLKATIDAEPSFKAKLKEYWETGDYPKYPRKDELYGGRLKHALILYVYMKESAVAQFMQAEATLPAPMIKRAIDGVTDILEGDPSLIFQRDEIERQKSAVEEQVRDQLPTFEIEELPVGSI